MTAWCLVGSPNTVHERFSLAQPAFNQASNVWKTPNNPVLNLKFSPNWPTLDQQTNRNVSEAALIVTVMFSLIWPKGKTTLNDSSEWNNNRITANTFCFDCIKNTALSSQRFLSTDHPSRPSTLHPSRLEPKGHGGCVKEIGGALLLSLPPDDQLQEKSDSSKPVVPLLCLLRTSH